MSATSPNTQLDDAVVIEQETPGDAAAVAALVDEAFGPGRYAKAAERLREDNRPLNGLSFVARDGGAVVGSVRLWPVTIGETRAAFLGPIAVEDDQRRRGLGAMLIERACEGARAKGFKAVLLVGDEPYFGRFGFHCAAVKLPGPVDPRRVLINALDGEAPQGAARRA